ncbi:hypothetical protein SAMN03159341_10157 [Paenibacillus sp. 1_12]|uniref:hypothetical protein n=1 Tax=Paenibacillus sp. 1_12 TaxID=1566278 RepID=UPI0008E8C8AE|nr:hypothetical protein [Paenibacillus sp. 1_12]SFK67947.1 hypothetical protein SAMN03159341_10157 [Paenibacillus sp. 1_12]
MKKVRKQALSVILISSLLLSLPYNAVFADEPQASVVDTRYPSVLTGSLQVKINGLLSEHTLTGTRIGTTIKMYNVSNDTVRVPDYEIRVVTGNGARYVLRGSSDNAISVPPMSNIELSYMAQVELADNLKPTSIVWVDVNKDVYPKVETTMLDLPVSNLVWYGDQSVISDPTLIKKWGEAFTIPSLDSALTYTPINLTTDFKDQTPVQVIKLLVQNPGKQTEVIPGFIIAGKSSTQNYKGARADQSVSSLDPGEKKYLYWTIPTDLDTQLNSFTLSTPEAFKIPNRSDASANLTYYIGRLSFGVPAADQQLSDSTNASSYLLNTQIPIDPINNVVNPNINVSVADFQIYENKGMGYSTGIVKMRFSNKGDKPLPIPQFAAELMGNGPIYAGNRINASTNLVVPGTDYLVNYSFVLPVSGTMDQYNLRLIDNKTAAPYKINFAQAILTVNKPLQDTTKLMLYPYEVTIHDWALSNIALSNPTTLSYKYSYKLRINMDLQTPAPLMVDSNYNKLLLELETKDGRRIATNTQILNGEGRLTSGEQLIYFTDSTSDQLEYPIVLKIYEVIETPNGPVRRLAATLNN